MEFSELEVLSFLIAAGQVFIMVPGLALFYGGLVRHKNVIGTMMHSITAISVVSVLWVLWGYSLAFGNSAGGLGFVGDLSKFGMVGVGLHEQSFMVFQGMFAIITVALISGGFAERFKFPTYVVFAGVWVTVVYAPHTRTIGSTLQYVFVLPMPANAGNIKSRIRKVSKQTTKQGPSTIKRKSAIRAPKPKLTDEQKRELRRVRAAEERQRRKELGLCRDCPNTAIAGQTRCADCAERHRQSR